MALCVAAYKGRNDNVATLVRLNADVNMAQSCGDGYTPLCMAAWGVKTATVGQLLELGALPSTRNKKGLTPRDLALAKEHGEVVALLQHAEQQQQPAHNGGGGGATAG